MNNTKTIKQDLSSDSIAAGYTHSDEWLRSTPLPVVQPIYNTSIYFLPSVATGEALISETVYSLHNYITC